MQIGMGRLFFALASLSLVTLSAATCDDSTSTGGGAIGDSCEGVTADACGSDGWCDYQPSNCGRIGGDGECKARPGACPRVSEPTCGCDGVVYDNACIAQNNGVDVDFEGNCTPPENTMFPCGAGFCDLATQYCENQGSDIGGEDGALSCMPLPASCGSTPSCACLDMERCKDRCDGDATSGMTTVCFGG